MIIRVLLLISVLHISPISFGRVLYALLALINIEILLSSFKGWKEQIKRGDILLLMRLLLLLMVLPNYFLFTYDTEYYSRVLYGARLITKVDRGHFDICLVGSQLCFLLGTLILLRLGKIRVRRLNISTYPRIFAVINILILFYISLRALVNLPLIMHELGNEEAVIYSSLEALLFRGGIMFAPFSLLKFQRLQTWPTYLAVCIFLILPELAGGSRSQLILLLFYFIFIKQLVLPRKPSQMLIFSMLFFFVMSFAGLSMIRVKNSADSISRKGSVAEAYALYSDGVAIGILRSLGGIDRVRPVALAMYFLHYRNERFSYGQTLLARPINSLTLIFSKAGFETTHWETSDEMTFRWRFGDSIENKKGSWSLPISVIGQFYVQYGLFAFLPLLCALYLLLKKLLVRLYYKDRYLNVIWLYLIIQSLTTEIFFYSVSFMFILPIYLLILISIRSYVINYNTSVKWR